MQPCQAPALTHTLLQPSTEPRPPAQKTDPNPRAPEGTHLSRSPSANMVKRMENLRSTVNMGRLWGRLSRVRRPELPSIPPHPHHPTGAPSRTPSAPRPYFSFLVLKSPVIWFPKYRRGRGKVWKRNEQSEPRVRALHPRFLSRYDPRQHAASGQLTRRGTCRSRSGNLRSRSALPARSTATVASICERAGGGEGGWGGSGRGAARGRHTHLAQPHAQRGREPAGTERRSARSRERAEPRGVPSAVPPPTPRSRRPYP